MRWPGLPLGGGKSVILADQDRNKTPDMLHAFGKAVDHLGGRYVTAEDVGISVADMIEVARVDEVRRRPAEFSGGDVGGDPGPHTSLGVFLGIKAAVKRALGKDSAQRTAYRNAGRGQRRDRRCASRLRRRARSCRLPTSTRQRRRSLRTRTSGKVVSPDEILGLEADVFSPNALGRDPRPRRRSRN